MPPIADAVAACLKQPGTTRWLDSTHVVTFDVDVGHCSEWSSSTTEADAALSLCMAAMPDSQPASGGLGDCCFTFRFPRARQLLWGFSFFRACRDASCRRGVFQVRDQRERACVCVRVRV